MASTSGRINSGSGNSTYFYFQWQLAGQNIGGNYSTINWQWGVNISGGAFWQSNAIKSVSGYIDGGLAFGANTWSNISGNGDHQLLAGSWNIGHNSDGSRSFGMSSTGWLYLNGNFSNSGGWDLPQIPRHATITGATGVIDDEALTYYVTYSNPAGAAIDAYIDLPSLGVGAFNRVFNYGSGNPIDFTTDITAIRTAMVNSPVQTIRYVIHDTVGGSDSWSYIDTLISIKNDHGQANPTFTDYTYKDNNSTTSTITGNDQYLIQGYSDLLVTVSTANKATPNKNAVMDHYLVNIGGYSNNAAYSSGSDVTKDVGTISDITGARTLAVSAYDSRYFFTTINKTVNILPYSVPVVSSTAVRSNGYDDALILTLSGSVSPLTISGTDKNSIHSSVTSTANKVEYRYSTDGGSFGSWIDLSATQTSGTGIVTGNSTVTIAASGSASSQHSFQIQVKITDKLNSTTQTINVSKGTPIFRIGTDGNLYYQELQFISTNSVTSGSTISPVGNAALNMQYVTALAANTTISAPSGTLSNGNRLIFRFKDNGSSRTITWNSIFRGGDTALPTATTTSKTLYVGFVYNSADSKWDCVLATGGL